MAVIEASSVSRSYGGRRALSSVSFEARAGERIALIGPNGAGKTTLLEILAGIGIADQGRVQVAGGQAGWVPQQAALYRRLTVAENLRLFARLERVADVDAAVEEMLHQAGLGDRRGDQVATLSGGTQQRVNIAIGLLSRPQVLLLDEPTTALDPRQRERLWAFIETLGAGGTTVLFATHNIAEAEHYGERLLVLADGELLFDGTPAELHRAEPDSGEHGFEVAFVAFLKAQGPLMRWLLLKDLQLLRRSPLLTALLVIYPIVISILIGFALSGGPDKPRVAFLNLVPTDTPLDLGGEEFDVVGARGELCERIDCIRVETREEAVEKVESGDALAALILPADLIEKLRSLGGLSPERPVVEILVNEEDPVKGQFVDDRISTLLAEANLRLSQEVTRIGVGYLDTLVRGGEFALFGQQFVVLGMERAVTILSGLQAEVDADSPAHDALAEVIRFASLARDNLDVADDLLAAVSEPIDVDKQVLSGDAPSLESFAIAVSVAFTLMFVTVLLVAGSLALEREENAYGRLTRGLVSRSGLLTAKLALGLVCSVAVTVLMLGGLELFVSLEWGRFGLWLAAIAFAAVAFGAFGAAIGALAADVRAASLLAFMVSMPVAFLSLVPSGTVGKTAFDLIEIATAAFPFDPALRAVEAGLESAGPNLGLALLHLAILTVAWSLIARFGLRRLA